MIFDDLTIGEAKKLAFMFGGQNNNAANSPLSKVIGKTCVVRTYSAGVHIGKVISINGTQCELENARRLYSWQGAFTLSAVARNGISKESRMSIPIDIFLTQAIEFIECTDEALKTFDVAKNG